MFITTSGISVISSSRTQYARAGEHSQGRDTGAEDTAGQEGAHLWCHEVCCITRSHEEAILSPQLLGKAKVTNADAFGVS